MGAKSKTYIVSLSKAMVTADTDVNRCQQFMIGIDGNRATMDEALAAIEKAMKASPNATYAALAKADPAVKKNGDKYDRATKELDDYKTKFAKTIGEAAMSMGNAQVVIDNFTAFCAEKAKTWNPLKKKSLGKSVKALAKARGDLHQLHTFLDGIVALQRAKGNIV